jgi:predicted nuclease of predicted toxin-antitoxin system
LRSKKRSKSSQERNAPVFFLDRQLGSEKLVALLRPAGFKVFSHQSRYGAQGQNISDVEVIAGCGREHRVLLSADSDFEYMYGAEIKAAKIAAFVLSNNHEGPSKWGPRIIQAKDQVLLELKRRKKPFVGHINEYGRVTKIRLYRRNKTKEIKIGR